VRYIYSVTKLCTYNILEPKTCQKTKIGLEYSQLKPRLQEEENRYQ
jgi:hypothetical protein